jgi:hypothetical protein
VTLSDALCLLAKGDQDIAFLDGVARAYYHRRDRASMRRLDLINSKIRSSSSSATLVPGVTSTSISVPTTGARSASTRQQPSFIFAIVRIQWRSFNLNPRHAGHHLLCHLIHDRLGLQASARPVPISHTETGP